MNSSTEFFFKQILLLYPFLEMLWIESSLWEMDDICVWNPNLENTTIWQQKL